MAERARLFEEITPMRYVPRCGSPTAPTLVADQLTSARTWFRDELETVFARELDRRPPAEARDLLDTPRPGDQLGGVERPAPARGLLGGAGPARHGPHADPAAAGRLRVGLGPGP